MHSVDEVQFTVSIINYAHLRWIHLVFGNFQTARSLRGGRKGRRKGGRSAMADAVLARNRQAGKYHQDMEDDHCSDYDGDDD